MENFSVEESYQQMRESSSFQANNKIYLSPSKLIFRRIVVKVLRKLQGDLHKNMRNNILDYEQNLQGFHDQINPTSHFSFRLLCVALAEVKKLKILDLSGCNINAHFAIELSDAIKQNTSLSYLSLASCNLSAFSLSCIFQSLSHNLSLSGLNLMNNQSFNMDAVEDFCEYVLKGKINLSLIVLTHCNIDNYLLSIIFRNIHHLKTLKHLKVNLMSLNSEGLFGLRSLLMSYNGKQSLDILDLSYNYIKDDGIILLNNSLALNFQNINIQELDLSRNCFSQVTNLGITALESLILKFKNLQILNVSLNSIKEFTNPKFLELSLQKINLSKNNFSEIPMNFLLNVQFVDLSMNQIRVKGAYHISQILSKAKTQWQVLNLNDNMIMPEGFISIIYALSKFNKTLLNLQVANNMLDGHAILYYAANHSLLSLRSIDISRNHFRYQLVYALLNMIKDCPLSYIDFSKIKYQRDELEFIDDTKLLFEIKSFNVRCIDFSYNPLMINSILRSLSHSYVRLESVNFSHCDIVKNESIALFNKFLSRSQNLQYLNLAGNQLGSLKGECLKAFAFRIGQCISLQYLNLQSNQIKSNLKFILLSLQNLSNLQDLDLSGNMIQDTQYLPLLHFFQSSHVQTLDLSNNYLSMQSLEAILYAFQNPSTIQVINLSQNRLNGQHLLSLKKLIERDQLKVLNLSSNNQLEKLKSFFYTSHIPVIHSLTLNNLQFSQKNFNIFLQSIQANKRVIQSIDVENTLLQAKQLKLFLMSLSCTRQLKTLALQYVSFDYYPIIQFMSENLMPTLKRLSRISLIRCVICEDMWSILVKLIESSQCLQDLDLSGNFLNDINVIYITTLIKKTKSLKNLTLQNCNINDNNIQKIVLALDQNYTIKTLDFSFNSLSCNGIQSILNVKNTPQDEKLTTINLLGCLVVDYEYLLAESRLEQREDTKQLLKSLDLSENRFLQNDLIKLINTISNRLIFPNIKSLNLSRSQLNDENCDTLSTLLKLSILTVLNLSNNQISDSGLQILLTPLQEPQACLKILNLEKNLISRQVFLQLINTKLNSLKVLILAFNFTFLTIEYSTAIIQIYKNNPDLFIYNYWSAINEELARLIIQSYINLYNSFRLGGSSVPDYMRVLKIENSDISDEFCVYFASSYFYFPYLETLSFSNSPRITKYGKIYLYLTLFQDCYQDFDLKHFYFNEERNFSTVFDDGIRNYMLINIKFWLQQSDKDLTETSRSKYEDSIVPMQESQGRMGMIGKIIINIINKALQTEDQHFTFSSNFMKYMIQNQLNYPSYSDIGSIRDHFYVNLSINLIRGIQSPSPWHQIYPKLRGICDKQASEGYLVCYLDSGLKRITLTYSTAITLLSISILLSTIDIFVAIQVRKKANPDYKILSPQTDSYLKRSLPHKGELGLYFLTIFDQLSYFFAFNQIYILQLIVKIYREVLLDYTGEDQQFIQFHETVLRRNEISLYLFVVVVCFKIIYQYLNKLVALRQVFQTQSDTQRVDYLNSLWRKNIYEHNYVLLSFLQHFCPQSGQRIWKTYFTQQQIIEFVQAFLIELPQLILSVIYISDLMAFLTLQMGIIAFPIRNIFAFLGLLKFFLTFLFNVYHGFTTKHPKIKEQEFNQALFFRRFRKVKSEAQIEYQTTELVPFSSSPLAESTESDQNQNSERTIKKKLIQPQKFFVPNLKKLKKSNFNEYPGSEHQIKLDVHQERKFSFQQEQYKPVSKRSEYTKSKQD